MSRLVNIKHILIVGVVLAMTGLFVLPAVNLNLHVEANCGTVIFKTAAGTPLTTNPVIYKPMHIELQACTGGSLTGTHLRITSPNDPAINVDVPMQGGSTQTSVNTFEVHLPQGFTIKYELLNGAGQVLHIGEASLERNTDPGKIADVPTGSTDSGCCSNDSQCKGSYGQVSSCTGPYNGLCQSGRQCSGGTVFKKGQACDDGQTGVCETGTVCTQIKSGAKQCLSSCNLESGLDAQWNCFNSRYEFSIGTDAANQSCKSIDPNCACSRDTFIGGYEASFTGNNSQSTCAVTAATGVDFLFFADPKPTCNAGDVDCTSIVPNVISASDPASATVNIGCMPAGNYVLVVASTKDGTSIDKIYKREVFTVGAGDLAKNISLGVVPFEETKAIFAVVPDTDNASLSDIRCVHVTPFAIPGSAPVTDPGDAPDPSTDFGSRNCPFAVACEESALRAAYPPSQFPGLVDSLLALCDGDTSRGIYRQDKSASAKPAADQYQEFLQCSRCVRGVDANGNSVASGTWTEAFGCVITSPEGIFTALIRIALGVMGGVALLRITYLGIITAQSKDEGKIAEARKGVIATLGGIAIVILSVLILRIIGVNILDIVPPGFF